MADIEEYHCVNCGKRIATVVGSKAKPGPPLFNTAHDFFAGEVCLECRRKGEGKTGGLDNWF